MITSITIDTKYNHYSTTLYYKEPVIIIGYDGSYNGQEKTHKATSTAIQWAQRYIARHEGAIKVNNPNSATWYHNVDSMYNNGYTYNGEFLTFEVLPDWRLKITLTLEGREVALERLEGLEKGSPEWNREIIEIELDLFEYALSNGWTLDPNDDGSWFISLDASIDDYGSFDVNPGDLGWSYSNYMVYFVGERLIEKGHVVFDPYYFGETSLEDQRAI